MGLRLLGVLLLTAPLLGGCTLLGAGIGGTVPSWERVPAGELSGLRHGTHVEVRAERLEGLPVRDPYARAASPAPLATRTVQGESLGVHRGALLVGSPTGVTVVPLESTRRVRRKSGSYWWAGGGIGLAVDAITIAYLSSTFDPGPRR